MENLATKLLQSGEMLIKNRFVATNKNRDCALCSLVHATRYRRFKCFNTMLGGDLCHGFDFFFAIGRILDPCAAFFKTRKNTVFAGEYRHRYFR